MRWALVFLAGCAAASPAVETTSACQRAIGVLTADHAAGLTCEAAKAHAAQVEPMCHLAFTCKGFSK